ARKQSGHHRLTPHAAFRPTPEGPSVEAAPLVVSSRPRGSEEATARQTSIRTTVADLRPVPAIAWIMSWRRTGCVKRPSASPDMPSVRVVISYLLRCSLGARSDYQQSCCGTTRQPLRLGHRAYSFPKSRSTTQHPLTCGP